MTRRSDGAGLSRSRRIVLLTLAIVTAYAVARHFVYRAMPMADTDAWFTRDLVMTGPRLGGFALCLVLMKRSGGWKRWGWSLSWTRAGSVVLALTAAIEVFLHLAHHSTADFSRAQIALGWLATGPVALFEEAACRSLLFLSLRDEMSPLKAAWLSSALFAGYHIEAQPAAYWGHILAFGLGCCTALQLGVGLGWLVAAHWFVDGSWYHLSAGPGAAWAWLPYRLLLIGVPASSVFLLKDGARGPGDRG